MRFEDTLFLVEHDRLSGERLLGIFVDGRAPRAPVDGIQRFGEGSSAISAEAGATEDQEVKQMKRTYNKTYQRLTSKPIFLPRLTAEEIELLQQEAKIRREFGEEGVKRFWQAPPNQRVAELFAKGQ